MKVLLPSELPEFTRLWQDKEQVDVSLNNVGGEHFKVDIVRQRGDGRWLYWTTGYTSFLDIAGHPVYKLRDPVAFNKLIGATK